MRKSKVYMISGASMLIALFLFPMWSIKLKAPQYPNPIGMNIHINKFTDANPNDIKNINIMNHYVGMKDIPKVIPEFKIFPYFTVGMILLGIAFGLIGNQKLYLVWLALMLIICSIAMYDFYLWEYEYGHDLKETAAIKFTDNKGEPMVYQPPLIGNKNLLNFKASSWPNTGAYFMFLGMILSFLAFYVDKKNQNE